MANGWQAAHVAVGVDFSPAEEVLDQAVATSRRLGARLTLLHICQTAHPGSDLIGAQATVDRRDQLAAGERELMALCGELRHSHPDLLIEHHMVEGRPHTQLAVTAGEIGADLLIVGTHGRTGWRRLLLGSVAERTARAAEIDVLVVRGQPARTPQRILVGYDFTDFSDRAVDAAIALAPPDAAIHVVHAVEPPTRLFDPKQTAVDLAQPMAQSASKRLAERVDRWRRRFPEISAHAQLGDPISVLVNAADSGDHDLIAVGSHGHGGLRGWMLGSVAESVVRYAGTQVLVAKLRTP